MNNGIQSTMGRFIDEQKIMVEKPPFPHRIMLEVSSICNHKCIFCGVQKGTRKKQIIGYNLAMSVIKQGAENGADEICFHSMGEPLLCKELTEYVKYSKELNYKNVFIDTNGSLAVPEKVNPLVDAGIDDIKFSINAGNTDDYLKIHGKGDFNQVIENIKNLREYIDSVGASTKLFVSFIETNITKGQWKGLKDILGDCIDRFWVFKVTTQGGNMIEEHKELTVGSGDTYLCTEPFDRMTITADGMITACCIDNGYNFVYGDANRQTLIDAWNSDQAIAIRLQHITGTNLNMWCKNCAQIVWAKYLNNSI